MKYKVGDTITIRKDLELTCGITPDVDVIKSMLEYAGKEAEIICLNFGSDSYNLSICDYIWTDEMFEGYVEESIGDDSIVQPDDSKLKELEKIITDVVTNDLQRNGPISNWIQRMLDSTRKE